MISNQLKRSLAYHLNLPLVPPKTINFGITNRCNFHCPICNTKDEISSEKEEISLETIEKTIREIGDWNRSSEPKINVSFAGGEPLIREKATIEAITLASKLGIRTHLTTNGSFIDAELAQDLIEAGVSSVSVSLDGHNAAINNCLRGEGTFKTIIEGIRNLVDCKERLKSDTTISTVTVITKQNQASLMDIYQFAKSLGVDKVNYNPYTLDNSFMAKGDYEQDRFWISEDEIQSLASSVRKLKQIKQEEEAIDTPDNILNNLVDYFKLKEEFKKGECLAGHSYMHIKPNGEVDVCGKGPSFSSRPMNIKERDIKSIWRSFNFFITRLKIKRCQRPCLMLCFEKTEKGLSQRLKAFLSLHRERG